MRIALIIIFSILLISSCKKTDISGDASGNLAPETYTLSDTIIKQGNDRFSTRLNVKWWGDDPDGYITGYEYSFDSILSSGTVWSHTISSDTTFFLSLPPGQDTLDISFWVRAIDQLGKRDPSPANIWYPIKNTKPTMALEYLPAGGNPLAGGNQLVTFPALRFNWQAADDDGEENLSYFEIYLNDTTRAPFILDKVFSGITIQANTLTGTTSSCAVYPGLNDRALPNSLEGLLLNDSNVLYIRAVDLSEARSSFSISKKVFVKTPKSTILLINGFGLTSNAKSQFYTSKLNSIGVSDFDEIKLLNHDIVNGFIEIAPDNETQARIFEFFDHIIWAGEELDFSVVYAQGTLGRFVDKGGNILMSTRVGNQTPIISSLFQTSPIDSVLKPAKGFSFLMTDTSKVLAQKTGYPDLKYTEFLSVTRPVRFVNGSEVLYDASILERNNSNFQIKDYKGYSGIIGMKENIVTGSKYVFSALQLDLLDGNGNIDQFLNKILKDEFKI